MSEKKKTLLRKDTCTPVFIAALFIIAKVWKCPSADEWIKKMEHTYTMEHYSAIKKNPRILPFVTRWMDLENIILNEIN